MRSIVTISLSKELNEEVERFIKEGHYASKSEFFRHLIRLWKHENTFREVVKSREEIQDGYGKKLRSLKDLR